MVVNYKGKPFTQHLLTQSEHTAKQGWICHSVQATEEKERLNGQFRRDGLYTVQFQSFVLTTVATIEPEPTKPDESSDDDI